MLSVISAISYKALLFLLHLNYKVTLETVQEFLFSVWHCTVDDLSELKLFLNFIQRN